MKTYDVIVSEGNINGWHNPQTTGQATMNEAHAETLNAQKDNTGIEYVEVTGEAPAEATKEEIIDTPAITDTPTEAAPAETEIADAAPVK